MGNSLLDFVMALVRDPDAAAQYAADPAGAIAAAGLTEVSSVDVDQLIPVVTESLSSAVPTADANVWASGAATAAFDAFGIEDALPVPVADLHDLDVPAVVDTASSFDDAASTLDDVFAGHDLPAAPVIDDAPVSDPVFESEVPAWASVDGALDTAHPDLDLLD
ncbi:Rv0340 family IniB-related protein [Mycobacterium sp. NPDC003323]